MASTSRQKPNGKKPQPLSAADAAALQFGRSVLESASRQVSELVRPPAPIPEPDARTRGAVSVLDQLEDLRGGEHAEDDWRAPAIAREVDGWRDRISRLQATVNAVEAALDEGVSAQAHSTEIRIVAGGVRNAVAGATHELTELLVFAGRLEAFAEVIEMVERQVDVHVQIEAEKRAAKASS